jgi:hypothetical protein
MLSRSTVRERIHQDPSRTALRVPHQFAFAIMTAVGFAVENVTMPSA